MALQYAHYQHSTYREKLLEHLFLGELLQFGWLEDPKRMVDVIRPEVDNRGYDLLLESGRVRRYVQLKSSKAIDINVGLFDMPGACVIKIYYREVNGHIALRYRYFGQGLDEYLDWNRTLPARIPNKRRVPMDQFEIKCGAIEIFNTLFP